MKKKGIFLFVIMICILPSLFSRGRQEDVQKMEQERVLIIASNCQWPPLEFVDEDGQLQGLEIDLLRELEKVIDMKILIVNVDWGDLFSGLDKGHYDGIIGGLGFTEERAKKYALSRPYLEGKNVIIAPINQLNQATSLADLAGKTVGVLAGSLGCQFIEKNDESVHLKKYLDVSTALFALLDGSVDYVVTGINVAHNYTFYVDAFKGKLKITGDVGDPVTPMLMIVQKDDTETLHIINDGLAILESHKVIDALMRKWNYIL
jgi:polar amino acid transport system substrate-binding protein